MRNLPMIMLAITGLVMAACGDDDDPGVDAGPMMNEDAGMMMEEDGGTMMEEDGGGDNECFVAAGADDPSVTVGCNGGVLGNTGTADNEPGGRCGDGSAMMPVQGTCMEGNFCFSMMADWDGICLPSCTPDEGAYVSQGGCPNGSRCFTLAPGFGVCFVDCDSNDDCWSGFCDPEGSCQPAVSGGDTDAGPGDTDAGEPDAGA